MSIERKIYHILLIDDEKGVVQALSLLLKAVGYNAISYHIPAEALAYLKDQQSKTGSPGVDLVLSDLRMPELDGLAVLKEIKQHFPSLPFILMSGHATDEDTRKALALGAAGFLSKPFSPDALNSLVSQIELDLPVAI